MWFVGDKKNNAQESGFDGRDAHTIYQLIKFSELSTQQQTLLRDWWRDCLPGLVF